MAMSLPRIFALMALTAAPAFAGGLPVHPPSPPPRPTFPSDPPPGSPEAEAPVEEAPLDTARAQPAPQEASPYGAAPQDPNQQTPGITQQPLRAATGPAPAAGEPPPDGFNIAENAGLAGLTRKYAQRHGVPLELLHRIIMRESRYRPRLVNHAYYGLMQITPATARAMGYAGSPRGLLDAETNLAYATPYLANAWALADGDMTRAVSLYAAGYYYTAKSKGMLSAMRNAHSPPVKPVEEAQEQPTLATPPPQPGFFDSLFAAQPPR